MKRQDLERLAAKALAGVQTVPMVRWLHREFPVSCWQVIDSHLVHIGLDLLDVPGDHLALLLTVSSPERWVSSHRPVRRRVLIASPVARLASAA